METNKKWTNSPSYTPLMQYPKKGLKILDLNPATVIESTGETSISTDGLIWECVLYNTLNKTYVGWIESRLLDPYAENYARDCVDILDIQTPDPTDAEQYVLWDKYRQVNLCGELAVCYLLNIELSTLLKHWQVTQPSFFKRIFGQGMARGTGDGELVEMFALFGGVAQRLTELVKVYTPYGLSRLLQEKGVIVGVKIDSKSGRLRGQGVGHWVVVTKVFPERVGYGMVEIYNPFPNRIETYSWQEFLASARSPFGAVIVKE